MAHRSKKKKEDKEYQSLPKISMDYFFMSEQDKHAGINPVIIIVDEKTGENTREL